MRKPSKNGSKTQGSSRLSKAPSPALLARARTLAWQYRLLIQPSDGGGFTGSTVEMPLVFGEGTTFDACARDILEATAMTIAIGLELGERPPAPAIAGKRESQVNIRMNADEKMQIEELARRAGYRSISDYMRVAALRPAS